MDWDREQAPLLQILRAAVERGAEGAAALPILVTARPEGARDSATRSSWASPGDLVPGVWFGNDDASPMRTTSRGAPPPGVWRNFMQSAFADEIAAAHEIAAAQGPSEPAFLLDAA
jgi:penicillin-binding protein 1A